jgi:hypothetical protein
MSEKPTALKEGDALSGLVVKIYATTRNTDGTEGRGIDIDNSYHKERRSALIASKGIDVMGSDGKVVERLAIKLNDGRYFLLQNENHPIVVVASEKEVQAAADLRKEALGKLSRAERAALGL